MTMTIVRMPHVLAGVAEAAVQSWLVSVGDSIVVGQPIADLETEKATIEYKSEVEGSVFELLVAAGESVSVGQPLLSMTTHEDDAPPAPPLDTAPPPHEPTPQRTPAPRPEAPRIFGSPLARRLARQRGVDLSTIVGSGPHGRIVRRDLDRLAQPTTPPNAVPSNATPLNATAFTDSVPSAMRRTIARRLTESKSTVPHFYLAARCRVDALLSLKAQLAAETDTPVSVTDLLLRAAALAYRDVPEANAVWVDGVIRRFSSVDISLAIALPDGLVAPVIRGVDAVRLDAIHGVTSSLADRARAGQLVPADLEGGVMSITNLGMHGVEEFTAIINPPQSAILAVGAAVETPVVTDGVVSVASVLTVTLSLDHRVLDGVVGARWLAAFQRRVEHPLGLVL